MLPAYTLLLGLIALLGYMAHAASIKVDVEQRRRAGAVQGAVPVLVRRLRVCGDRDRRAGAGGGHVDRRGQPVHPQFWKSYVNPDISHAGEASVAKIASLVVKVGALAFILFLPTQYALNLQLLGGLWILQTFPALVFGLFTRWFRAEGLLLGWAVGIIWGSWTAWSNGLKPLANITLGGVSYVFYVGLGALILNVVVAAIATVIVARISPRRAVAAS